MKKIISLFVVLVALVVLAGCKTTEKATTAGNTSAESTEKKPYDYYSLIPQDTVGNVTIMMWSGDNIFYEDLGNQEWNPEEVTAQNTATLYAVAKEFKKIFPNIKVNVYAVSGDPGGGGTSWFQKRQIFKETYGHWPDIFATIDLINDLQNGMISDLSYFKDDEMFKTFNPSIMGMMNYYGFQAGLPQYIVPDAIYVNRELALDNNITPPDPDWDLDEYTRFIKRANGETFWGAMDANQNFINTGTTTMHYQLFNYKGTGDYINLNSDEVRYILDEYFADWAANSIWPLNDSGLLPEGTVTSVSSSGYTAFRLNKILTYDGEIWNMGNAAHTNPDHATRVNSEDWDLYPRPATPYRPNTVAVRNDPVAIHNYAMDDGNKEMSDAELLKLKTSYAFSAFWFGDTRSMQARADMQYVNGGVLQTSMNDSLPLIVGPEFEKQMQIWYSTDTHQRYADKEKMPGWHYIVEIWEKGQMWNVTDKVFPQKFNDESGSRITNTTEWNNFNKADVAGALRASDNFVDTVKSKLADWNTVANERYALAFEQLKQGLKDNYGYTDADFQ